LPVTLIGASLGTMSLVAGTVGALVGFAIGALFTEVIFVNSQSWPDVVPVALAVIGWLAARELYRRRHARKPEHGPSSAAP
jgi:hypothetical protein